MNLAKKYYTLANRYIDKLLLLYKNNYNSITDLEKLEDNFIYKESLRTSRNLTMAYREGFCFIMNYLVTITGLNKTVLENDGFLNSYETINIDNYNEFFNLLKQTCPDIVYEFEKDRIVSNKYDSFICLNDYNIIENDIFFNVRNSLLHSEFMPHCDDGDDCTVNIFDFENSDYHKIKGKFLTLIFQKFIIDYYSNVFATIQSYINIFKINDDELDRISNKEELRLVLTNLEVNSIKNDFENNLNASLFNSFNETIEKNANVCKFRNELERVYNKSSDIFKLNYDMIDLIIALIEKYYDCSFYSLDRNEQNNCIYAAYNYLENPKKSISEWLIHFYDLITAVSGVQLNINKFYGNNKWALEPALYLMKLYNCLYVIQNKSFEEIDVKKMKLTIGNLEYFENKDGLLDSSYQKYKLKHIDYSEEDIYKLVYLEIVRNALAHGNISFEYKHNEQGNLEEFFVFVDKYKSKERKIYIKKEDIATLINSECFLLRNLVLKENELSLKKRV